MKKTQSKQGNIQSRIINCETVKMSNEQGSSKGGKMGSALSIDVSSADMPDISTLQQSVVLLGSSLDQALRARSEKESSLEEYTLGQNDDQILVGSDISRTPIISTTGLSLSTDNFRTPENKSAIFANSNVFNSQSIPAVSSAGSSTGATPKKVVYPKQQKKQKKEPQRVAWKYIEAHRESKKSSSDCSSFKGDGSTEYLSGGEPANEERSELVDVGYGPVPVEVAEAQKSLYALMIKSFRHALREAYPEAVLNVVNGQMVISKPTVPSVGTENTSQEEDLSLDSSVSPSVPIVTEDKVTQSPSVAVPTKMCPDTITCFIQVKDIIKNKNVKVNVSKYVTEASDLKDIRKLFKAYLKEKKLIQKAHLLYDLESLKRLDM
nr:VP2 [Cambodia Anopheles rhabdovirus]